MIPCHRCSFSRQITEHSSIHATAAGPYTQAPIKQLESQNSLYVIGGRSGPARPKTLVTLLASLVGLRRWLADASDPHNSPILRASVSENAKRVYIYLAGIVYAFGSSHSRLDTIAKSTGISRGAARKAITELERRRFLSHRSRKTWHGRGAHDYRVKPIH